MSDRVRARAPLRFNPFKCHNNVELSEDNAVARASQHAWGGVTGTWVLEGGESHFEVRVEESRMGLGLYVGLVEASYKPHLRGQGMNSTMVPAKCAYEYCNGYSYYAHNGDLLREGRAVGHTGRRARRGDMIGLTYNAQARTLTVSVNGEKLSAAIHGVFCSSSTVEQPRACANVRRLVLVGRLSRVVGVRSCHLRSTRGRVRRRVQI